jgi:cytoskeletal protein CcmA (bactofilin family)
MTGADTYRHNAAPQVHARVARGRQYRLAASGPGNIMFSARGKNPKSGKTAPNPATAPSIVTADVVMTGTLATKSDVQVEDRIDGDVRCVRLVIGDAGQVNGNIVAEEVTIRGRLHGGIRARLVSLCRAAHVEGDILSESLAVEAGAIFQGSSRHSETPLAEAPNKVAEYRAVLKVFASTGR